MGRSDMLIIASININFVEMLTLNHHIYINWLLDKLLFRMSLFTIIFIFFPSWELRSLITFQHDTAPVHKAHFMKAWSYHIWSGRTRVACTLA